MEVLIFSDLHIYNHRKSLDRLQDCLDVLDWVFKTAKERNIKHVVFCGDLFHTRNQISILIYQKTFEIFEKYSKDIKSWLVIGNHDMWASEGWEISSLIPLNSIHNVNVIRQPCTIEIENQKVSFLPYTKNPIEAIENLESNTPLFTHIAIDGAILHGNSYAEEVIEHDGDMIKVNSKLFNKFKQVFMGHYHAEQKITDWMEYVGSPLQLTYGEAFQKKHIIVYNLETNEKEYIENNFSPKHFILNENNLNDFQLLPRDFLRVQVDNISSPKNIEIQKQLVEKNLTEVKIEPIKKQKFEDKLIIDNIKSLISNEDTVVEKYIDSIGTKGLDKNKLLEVFQKIKKQKQK